jgi:hypothetical protein
MGFHKKFKMQYLQMIRLALGLIEVRNEWRSLSFELTSSLIVLLTFVMSFVIRQLCRPIKPLEFRRRELVILLK